MRGGTVAERKAAVLAGTRPMAERPAAPEPGLGRRADLRGLFGPLAQALAAASAPWERTAESPLCRMDDGLPHRLDRARLRALGNAVVPHIPELLGRALAAEHSRRKIDAEVPSRIDSHADQA